MDKVTKAIEFAAKAHDGMCRKKDNTPYILHPLEAATIVGTMTDDQDIISAALLHDVVEDTGITIEEIEEEFGVRVRKLVESETENKRKDLPPENTWRIRKEESLNELKNNKDVAVHMIWIGDKLSNMRDIDRDYPECGEELWNRFRMKDKKVIGWYYKSIQESLREAMGGTEVYREYCELVAKNFAD